MRSASRVIMTIVGVPGGSKERGLMELQKGKVANIGSGHDSNSDCCVHDLRV